MSPWDPPEDVTALSAAQRVAFGLTCAEHLYPSFALQVRTHPASLPTGALSPSEYRVCLDALWAWLGHRDGAIPDCITEEHGIAAERAEPEGLHVLVTNAVHILQAARNSYEQSQHCQAAGGLTLNTVGDLADALLGPKPDPPPPVTIAEDKRIEYERLDAMARHEVVQTERAAQAEAVAALANGADPAELAEPAQQVGARIAEWAAQVV